MTFAYKALAAAVFTVAAAGAQAQTQAPSKMYAEIGYAAIGLDATDAVLCSAKQGIGIAEILDFLAGK